MKNLKKNHTILFLSLLLINYISTPFMRVTIVNPNAITTSQISSNLMPYDIENPHDLDYIDNWEKLVIKYDKNGNEIDDKFDEKLYSWGKTSSIVRLNSPNEKSFIIQFPNDYNYTLAAKIFEENGGFINFKYEEAINGFAGRISYYGFNSFCEILREKNIQFLIEEDARVKADLYYTSRNMNLRPYVWKTLDGGYTGDNTSSIAILDTGIDDSHEFFDNFSNGDFNYKIVNWTDFTLGGKNDTLYDDNGHGSHVAGIAAGMGTPILDEDGRMVSTNTAFANFTGWDFSTGGAIGFPHFTFDAPSTGQITIECNFTDYTPDLDRVQGWAWLFKDDSVVARLEPTTDNWENNLTYTITADNKGIYELWAVLYMDDGDGNGGVSNPSFRYRAELHLPFQPSTFGCGNYWKGVAPDTHLVGVKVLSGDGSGLSSWIIAGVDYVIKNRKQYNITVMSMSLGLEPHYASDISLINAVNNAVENGIVTVVSAGNDGAGGNYTGCPGDADNVITVAAMNYRDHVTEYSSQGGGSFTGYTNKPDIMAPGGSINSIQMFSADTNDNDGEKYPIDNYLNDTMPAQGTSMAAPAVAGAANLLIEAMGGGNNWDWDSGDKAKLVKAILLMTATETYPLQREDDIGYSPLLNRGEKDVHEGYGRLNIDAAIEAWTNDLTNPSAYSINLSVWLNTSQYNSFGKHAYAGYVDLTMGENVVFNLTVPNGADYDLYLYNNTPDEYGEPVIVNSSISSSKGGNEILNYTATHDGRFFLVVKAIGEYIPSGDNGNGDGKKTTTSIDFLMLFIIIGIIALLALVFVLILYKKGRKDYTYDFKPEY